ncbi:hypothetical protein [Microbispora sp. NPDC049125]|uniref:hypothetical protein n=1 Tax=Microbispora sp. NPDC049125 TaxID=3154929 RepID=UPI0034672C9B
MDPEEAARSLATIRNTQVRTLESEPWFPTWYTVGVGVVVTGVQFVTEPGTSTPVIVGASVLLTAALGALVGTLVRTRRVQAHKSLIPAALATFLAWMFVLVGVCLVIAFRLDALEVAYGRTWAALTMTALMAVTGPFVSRWIARQMARKIEKTV